MLSEAIVLNEQTFHPLSLSNHKQLLVLYSSLGSEILAAADGNDRGYDIKLSY